MAQAARLGRHPVVIGAGFIGLEVAASLSQMGLSVSVIEAKERIWPRFLDSAIAGDVQAQCEIRGIRFITGEVVTKFEGTECVRSVTTSSGRAIKCDIVCVGIGILPNVELAANAGLEVADGIVVDDSMRTSAPCIFAAGDAVQFLDPMQGKRARAEHWGHAEYSGQLAGENMTGGDGHYNFLSYMWSDVFNLHVEAAGHLDGFDQTVVRGDVDAHRYTSLYLRDGLLVAYCAINGDQSEFPSYRRAIRSRKNLHSLASQIADPHAEIRNLLR